jgi:sugar phosphate isomerase/epimerase
MPESQQKHIAEAIRSAGLHICVLGSDCKFALPSPSDRNQTVLRVISFVELAKAWNTPIVRVFGGQYDAGPSDDEVNAWVTEALREVAEASEELGIQIAIETHDAFSTGKRVRRVLDLTNHPSVGVVWDFAHPIRFGESVSQTWELIGSEIIHVHFKDVPVVVLKPVNTSFRTELVHILSILRIASGGLQ